MRPSLQRPGKELWHGVTKADLAQHLATVADEMLPHLRDRPLTLVRAPDGIHADRFFQKDAHHLAKHVETFPFEGVNYVVARSAADLLTLADQAVVELHGWVSRRDAPDRPDRLVFDLDPPHAGMFDVVREVARDLCGLLERRGGAPFPLLTGSKGIHVVVPLTPDAAFPEVVAFTSAVARVMARNDPRLTTELRKDRRRGRIFVDDLRNRPRQTAILPWSPRAREGAPFAVPVTRDDLERDGLEPDVARIGDASRWLERDAWRGFWDAATPLSRMLR